MFKRIHDIIYNKEIDDSLCNDINIISNIKILCRKAFAEQDDESLLEVHQVLYQINIAHLAVPWEKSAVNLLHPLISSISRTINDCWEQSERKKYHELLSNIPDASNFESWIRKFVDEHPKNYLHPIFPFLRDKASFAQMRDFFLQESPLEMLFGDIIAMMLPGVYSDMKAEISENFWDEVGHGKMNLVHRELRGNIMKLLDIPKDCYINQIELFERQELELINTYLSAAIDRTKMSQQVGALLATELMIPGRFVYQIEGWKRNGLPVENLKYLTDHVTVDAEHAEHWMEHVVMPLVNQHPSIIPEIVLGAARRLDVAGRVCDQLYTRMQRVSKGSDARKEIASMAQA